MKSLLYLAVFAGSITFASAQNTDSSQLFFNMGMADLQAGKYLVANIDFNKALTYNPRNTQALIQNGYTYLHISKSFEAKAAFEKAIELEPENQAVIKELSELYLNYRQFDKAIDLAQKCSSCENKDRILGIAHYQREEYGKAIQYLESAIQKNSNDAEAVYILGRTYIETESYQQAVGLYKKAVTFPDAKPLWYYELGLLQYNLEDYKSALASFRAAADKGYVATRDFKENFGFACLYTGEYDYGESVLLSLLADKPGNTDIYRQIADIFYKNKLYDKSLDYCQKLLQMNEKDARAIYQAGLCFQKKGQKDRGQKMCDKAIELDPSLASLKSKKEFVGL